MKVNEHLNKNRFGLAPSIRCVDGFNMSVQASSGHYCSPRNDVGPWVTVEVGFPSHKCDDLLPYAENADAPCNTVYGWVPVEVVDKVIADHGGIL